MQDHSKNNETHRKILKHKLDQFKSLAIEGLCFICVICNRCVYKKLVIQFKPLKYTVTSADLHQFYLKMISNIFVKHVRRKCLKRKIPCQALSNKLEVFNLPEKLTFVIKLKRVLVAKRILF